MASFANSFAVCCHSFEMALPYEEYVFDSTAAITARATSSSVAAILASSLSTAGFSESAEIS